MGIKIIIAGFKGKMGQAAYKMVTEDPELELVGLLDPFTDEKEVAGVPVFNAKEELAGLEAHVWVDFTTPKVAYDNTRFALEQGFCPVVGTTGFTPEQLEAAITPRTKMIWLSTPGNPSGTIYSKEDLEGLAAVLRKHPNIFFLADEIYEHINYVGKHTSMASIEGMYERTITVNGLSKAFAMPGWRMGYMGAPEWIVKACSKMQGQITSGANTIAQRASIAALRAPLSQIQYMLDAYRKRRDLVYELLTQIEGFKTNLPEGAFYFFPDISYYFGKTLRGKKIQTASDLSLYLLEEAHVATVTGEAFGNKNCIRLSYATSEQDLREALRRIKEAVTC